MIINIRNHLLVSVAISRILQIESHHNQEDKIMDDLKTTADQDTQTEKKVATEKNLSLAKEIEAFAAEVEADVDEAWIAFKAFVKSKLLTDATKSGDPVVVTPVVPEPAPEPVAETPAPESVVTPVPDVTRDPTPAPEPAPAVDTPVTTPTA